MHQRYAIIIGAGPAGLTAAKELLTATDIKPIIFEATEDIGGISKTVCYKGNRMDIGGHRFFSKSDRIMAWWQDVLPLQGAPSRDDLLLNRTIHSSSHQEADPEKSDHVMLIRNRLSRIFFLRRFFDYPVSLNFNTIRNLGLIRILKIGVSYLVARAFPIKTERSLEDFFINRFGRELYGTFFKDYTEKVWGVPCDQIKPEWGAQRIKGLSITKAIWHALKKALPLPKTLSQKNIETSLIEEFFYPKLGPGQLWETVADQIRAQGGEIHFQHEVIGLKADGNAILEAVVLDRKNGEEKTISADYFISTMPIKDLVAAMTQVPQSIRDVANGLQYRDFMTVGLLLDKLAINNQTNLPTLNGLVPDNWIYIQEHDVKVGRLQLFNNWSPYLVADPNKVWLGMEYFCNEADDLWNKSDADFSDFAIGELEKIGIISRKDVRDSVVIRMTKTYPAYFGTYDQFDLAKDYLNQFENLFLVGRNGMHRYNNMDHSMLTAMTAVNNIVAGIKTKDNIWDVNTEEEYHEEKSRVIPKAGAEQISQR